MSESREDINKCNVQMDCLQTPLIQNKIKDERSSVTITQHTSLSTLIIWNISKALEKNPALDIKDAIASAQSRLEQVPGAQDNETILSEHSYERHLACALLAWQQLGHRHADSLCRFVETKKIEEERKRTSKDVLQSVETISQNAGKSILLNKTVPVNIEDRTHIIRESQFSKTMSFSSSNSYSTGPGPVVKLPVDTKIVMRLDKTSCVRSAPKKTKIPEKEILKKIDRACCYEPACLDRLTELDAATEELRSRAGMLARREAERSELLERAEAAWKDLERGYQRRLTLAIEKEEDVARLIAKAIVERNEHKEACSSLAKELNEKSDIIAVDRARFNEIDKEVCMRACERLKLNEESAKLDALVAEQSCRAAQLDRDLQFKEEQVKRKKANLESEVESVRALTIETERAMRAELSSLRDQISDVSAQLLDEDAQNEDIKAEIEELRKEKMEMIEDLEGCKELCEGRMQGKSDELMQKRDQLGQLKDRVMECRCKLPVHVSLEAKRTPSLVGLCRCSPEDRILEACSCTSLRSKLLSNLLLDLFSGLQSELGAWVIEMPCQLLKCLEDKHNWDRNSVVKSNLTNYFSRLLVGELDIAIATSIENYSAKWVGTSCADMIQMTPEPGDDENAGWQKRAIERRAQKLATKLAEQLFRDRADELTMEAKRTLASGPPPCECKPQRTGSASQTTAFPCLLHRRSPVSVSPPHWRPAVHDVTQLFLQMEDLKKDSLKKEDLKTMEEKLAKIIATTSPPQRSTAGSPPERCMEGERRPGKKAFSRIPTYGGEGKKNATTNQTAVYSCLVKNTQAANVKNSTAPPDWHQAMEDVTKLRLQIEDLKKDSLKKEDLTMMQNKLAKIVQRAGNGAKMNQLPKFNRHVTNEVITKEQKNSKISNPTGPFSKITNSISTKKKLCAKTQNKKEYIPNPFLRNRIDKPFKRKEQQYAVNVCLCGAKAQKVPNARNKHEMHDWKQKLSMDTVSLISSTVRQTKPINASFNSQDLKVQTFSNESEEQSCPSNCVCFHKIPSTTSIDKLLETLAKWKSDLDKSINTKFIRKSSCKINKPSVTYMVSNKKGHEKESMTDQPKTSIESKEESREISTTRKHDCLSYHGSKEWIGLNNKKTSNIFKKSASVSVDLAEPIKAIDSEYMGAVNLDKSNEVLCKCVNTANEMKSIKCITTSKARCPCNKIFEEHKLEEGQRNQELASVISKQGQNIKNIVVLDNISVKQEKNKSQFIEREMNSKLHDAITETHIFEPCDCDYNVTFLGVTLADINHCTTKKISADINNRECYNKSSVVKHVKTSREEHQPCKKNLSKYEPYKLKNDIIDFTTVSVTGSKKLISNVKSGSRNIIVDNDSHKECLNNEDWKKIEKKGLHTIYSKNNKGYNYDERFNKHKITLPDYSNESSTIRSQNNDEHNKYELIKSPSYVEISNKNKKVTDFNCDECEISQKNVITSSGSIHSVRNSISKVFNDSKNMFECSTITKQMRSCECTVKSDEFKKNVNVANQRNNEDVELDAQSLKEFKDKDESCVCCNGLNRDESKDLEENTFHLLEEYLKKKLDEFNFSCIPPEEEEKLFTVILQKVKQIILDSTNEIRCKCSAIEGKSQGSWNRAYGLLQEYLKIKIQKVQCACALVDDNNDAILPDVLEKICILIENDFERLKDVFGSSKNAQSDSKEIAKSHVKQVNFEAEVPVKDTNIVSPQKLDDQIQCSANELQVVNVKQNISSQVPLNLGMEMKSCGSLEIYNKDVDFQASINAPKKNKSCDCNKKMGKDVKILETKYQGMHKDSYRKKKENTMFNKKKITAKETNSSVKTEPRQIESQRNIKIDGLQKQNSAQILASLYISSSKECPNKEDTLKSSVYDELNVRSNSDMAREFVINSLDNEQILLKVSNNVTPTDSRIKNEEQANMDKIHENKTDVITEKHCVCVQKYKESELLNHQLKPSEKYSRVPYIGYTIDCSCGNYLGSCVCSKAISKVYTDMIINIWQKSMPNEAYFRKISYIMHNQTTENVTNLQSTSKKNIVEDNYFHDCETAISSIKDEQFVLKLSTENVSKTHVTTNTFEDNPSTDTDCSVNEDTFDWCECCSHNNPNKCFDYERLKSSIYFPLPIPDFNDHVKDKFLVDKNDSMTHELPKHLCDCDLVPICHVKMLVENIETRLATTQCTCDSLMPRVCPVHSI